MKNYNLIPNPYEILNPHPDIGSAWVKKNTAILVCHGIGHQQPLETLDIFAKNLAETFRDLGGIHIEMEQHISPKTNDTEKWFDNYIRLRNPESDDYIDIYEYYWAHRTEDKATLPDIHKWIRKMVRGARKFYHRNAAIGKTYNDQSVLFKQNGELNVTYYKVILGILSRLVPFVTLSTGVIFDVLSRLPMLSELVRSLKRGLVDSAIGTATNVISDVTIYNTSDAKSKFYWVRKKILGGCVNALRHLIEADDKGHIPYPQVIIAGHSLGSQIAFDCMNRLNILVNLGMIKGYDKKGFYLIPGKGRRHISDILNGFVTFGSPLDKIAFFLREHIPEEEYIRMQILYNYHGFKQRDWINGLIRKDQFVIKPPFQRLLDDVQWRNYCDPRDYVSGALDYYRNLTNINCAFKSDWWSFTHSRYWSHQPMYADMIKHLLSK